jgi:hypothetical protein
MAYALTPNEMALVRRSTLRKIAVPTLGALHRLSRFVLSLSRALDSKLATKLKLMTSART